MKRNKRISKAMRSGQSPYRKHGKSPCAHCRDITARSKRVAQQGASYVAV